jgi:glucosyl-dolichyl phosphate glucuronosyltransferase
MIFKKPRLSIVVATYNRSDLLAGLLLALTKQTVRKEDFEVLIVDNSPAADSRVNDLCKREAYANLNLNCIHYPVLGVSNARNRGAGEAYADLIGFLDDDTLPSQDWVERVISRHTETKADILGGPFIPFYTSTPPAWFKDVYATHQCDAKTGWLGRNKYLAGANMVWTRKLFEQLGGFQEHLGYVGRKKNYGEDTEIQQRAILSGYKIWYDVDLLVRHHFDKERMSAPWMAASFLRHGKAKAFLYFREHKNEDRVPATRQILSLLKNCLVSACRLAWFTVILPFRNRSRYPYFQNYLVEVIGHELGQFAFFIELANLKRNALSA